LNESADLLEITLAALKYHGFSLDDLLAAQSRRLKELGGFEKQLLLESTGIAEFQSISDDQVLAELVKGSSFPILQSQRDAWLSALPLLGGALPDEPGREW